MLYGFGNQLLSGTWTTLQVAVSALALGLILGLAGAAGQSASNVIIRGFTKTLINIIRGVPELLVMFFVYFGSSTILSTLFNHYVPVNGFTAGVFALSLIFASYASHTFRGAFLAVGQGQKEAALALGLSKQQTFFYILLPQAWRHALPGLGNLWLVLLKDTALVSLIGLADLMSKAQIASAQTHKPFTFYLAAAVIYLIITTLSEWLLSLWTRRISIPH